MGNVCVDAVLVTNVGQPHHANAVANVHALEMEFFPDGEVEAMQEEVFTPGTSFISLPPSRQLPRYGGGPEAGMAVEQMVEKGLYPRAIVIGPGAAKGHHGHQLATSTTVVDAGGRLRIKLPPGKKLGGVEVACGDTFFDQSKPVEKQVNKDQHYGVLGWAKLYVCLNNSKKKKKKHEGEWMLYNANVPPSGVLSGGPRMKGHVTLEEDEIVVESRHFSTWVMAYRIVYLL